LPETAIQLPLDSEEIIEICVLEFGKRLRTLSPLQLGKEYAGFSIQFSHNIKLFRLGSAGGGEKDTLCWAKVDGGVHEGDVEVAVETGVEYASGDPNGERMAHDLPLTVEANDGKGGKIKKKVRINDDGKK
jgi:hypothetical protein